MITHEMLKILKISVPKIKKCMYNQVLFIDKGY